MKLINVANTTKALTIAATLLAVGGAVTLFRADNNQSKALALNILVGSSAIAVASHFSSRLCDDSANYQAQGIVDQHESKYKKLETDYKELTDKHAKQATVLDEVKAIASKQSETITNRDASIKLLNAKLEQLVKSTDIKIAEYQSQVDLEDTRFKDLINEFKALLAESISERIYAAYNLLVDSVEIRLGDEKFKNIHPALDKFRSQLQEHYDGHCQRLNEIPFLLGDWQVILKNAVAIYNQVTDELTALRVKYRNLLNLDERRSLESIRDELEQTYAAIEDNFVPKNKALHELGELNKHSKAHIKGLEAKANDNKNSLDEMRSQVSDLLDEIDSKNLEIAKLQHQIAELKRPQYWHYAARPDLIMANGIIQYFEKLGIVLDRAGSNYQGWYAELSFHGDRNSKRVTLTDLNPHWDKLAPQIHCLNQPEFKYDAESDLFTCTVWLQRKPVKSIEEKVSDFRPTLAGADELINFVNDSYHIGLWGNSGTGKTTTISNVIGGLVASLGGVPQLKLTIPKLDADTQKMFPRVDYLGVRESIFGLLEAALEVQYRIYLGEQAFKKGQTIPDHDPIIFFIDEINFVFTRWGRINDADLEKTLDRFALTLSPDRLAYFEENMREELENYKGEFAKTLLKFVWQTGRSLRVKTLIAGQNLQPGSFKMMKNDIASCNYLAFDKGISPCIEYKVPSFQQQSITDQHKLLQECISHDSNLKYTGLYCPGEGKSYLGALPPPNYYPWDVDLLCPANSNLVDTKNVILGTENLNEHELERLSINNNKVLDNLDAITSTVQNLPSTQSLSSQAFSRFIHESKLPKKFQNLGYEALLQLYTKLPKKDNGDVAKTEAYKKVFDVSRSDQRKILSEFIDYLSNEFQ